MAFEKPASWFEFFAYFSIQKIMAYHMLITKALYNPILAYKERGLLKQN